MKWLKKLLGDDLFKQTNEKLGDLSEKINKHLGGEDVNIVLVKDGNWIPKDRLDQEIGKTKAAKAEVEERDGTIDKLQKQIEDTGKTIEDLKKSAGNKEELEQKITKLEADNQQAKTEMDELKKDHAKKRKDLLINTKIETALTNAKVSPDFAEFLTGKFDKSKIVIADDGETVHGLEDQVKTLKESHPKMFGETKSVGTDFKIDIDDKGDQFIAKEDVEKMTNEQVDANWDVIQKSMPKWDKKG